MRSLLAVPVTIASWLALLLLMSCRGHGSTAPLVVEEPTPVAVTPVTAAAAAGEAPPLSLTASDGSGLVLASVKARAVLEDPLALTEMELVFENPRDQQVEGRFEILLPPGARVTRFAMEIGGTWQEAEVVEKQQARRTYETYLHAARDPALLERDTGNRFRARVFPIAPRERKRLLVSYAQAFEDPSTPYRLSVRGLPWLEELDLEARIIEPDTGTIRVERRHVTEEVPRADLVVDREASSSTGVRHGDQVIARIEPLAGIELDDAPPFERLTVLMDTSASRALAYDDTVDGLGRLLQTLARRVGPVQLSLLAFDQEVVSIYEGPLTSFGETQLAALRSRRPLGASDLGLALGALASGRHQRLLLVSDGLVSAGEESDAALARTLSSLESSGLQRMDALVVGGVRDDERLRKLVRRALPQDGVLLQPEEDLERAVDRLLRATARGVRVEVPGARWWSPTELDGVQPGDHVLVYADLPDGRPMTVDLRGAVARELPIALRSTSSPLVERGWTAARIEGFVTHLASLQDATQSAELRQQVIELSVQHRIVNDFTAFLVLETEEDYARFGLDRRGLSDILVVRDTGAQLLRRASEPRPERAEVAPVEPDPTPSGPRGAISGRISHEQTRESIADALVILQCTCLSGTRETQSNANGLYAFRDLPPGTYTIQVLSGQADVSKVATLPRGAKFRANFVVDPDNEFRRTIRVQAAAVPTDGSEHSRALDRETLRRSVEPVNPDAPDIDFGLGIEPEETSPPSATAVGRTVAMEEFRNLPVSAAPQRDFTSTLESSVSFDRGSASVVQEFVETEPVGMYDDSIAQAERHASRDPAGIELAGTTGAEAYYRMDTTSVSDDYRLHYLSHEPHYAKVRHGRARVVHGPLRRREAEAAVRWQRHNIERCYFRSLIDDPSLQGRLEVELTVDESGRVTDVRRRGSTDIAEPEMLRCVDEVLRRVNFPARGAPVTVSQTFSFRHRAGVPPNAYLDAPAAGDVPEGPDPWTGTYAEINDLITRRRYALAWEQAIAWREAAPADVLALLGLAKAAAARGDLDTAARAYGSILDLHPSRADLRRFAAANLESLDEAALPLAVDAYRKARAQRPDHPSSHRNLALALLRQGKPEEAFEVLAEAIQRRYPPGRFLEVERILAEDLGIVAAVWKQRSPAQASIIQGRLATLGATMATTPSLRFVLTWETDVNDVDLHVFDRRGNHAFYQSPQLRSGGRLYADVTNGFGPECLTVTDPGPAYPYRLMVHYYARGPMGYGMGKVQVVHHDGAGGIAIDDRPFVVMQDDAYVEIGSVIDRDVDVAQARVAR